MLIEEQIAARQERARTAVLNLAATPRGGAYGDYTVKAASGKVYRVALRGPGLFENYCSCPDFAVNTLGTCKHIEALLQRLRQRLGRRFDSQRYRRTRASLSLHYGENLAVRLRLPAQPAPGLQAVAAEYCDAEGLLRRECFPRFARLLEELRKLDATTVVYSDVLDFIDRENELAEEIEEERRQVARLEKGKLPLKGLLQVPLYPYQMRGALFAACRGRVVLADVARDAGTSESTASRALKSC